MELILIAIAAILLLVLCLLTVSTLITGMSPMPSSKNARSAMLNQLEWLDQLHHIEHQQVIGIKSCDQLSPVLELGCGWGGLLMAVSEKYPNRRVIGYEMSWVPWLVSWLRLKLAGRRQVKVLRKNFYKASWPDQSILFCYLSPTLMQQLQDKVEKEEHVQGLISNTFALSKSEAVNTLQLKDLYHTKIYTYQFQQNTSSD